MQLQQVLMPNVFQQEALKRLEDTQEKRGVIVMPTGTGKTFLAVLWFKRILEKDKNARLLFICHNKDILSQANEKEFQKGLIDFEIDYGYYIGAKKEVRQATFATTQTLVRNLEILDKNLFDYIIVDEAHHYQANTFKKVVEHFTPKFLLGLTATPNRMDNRSIFKICGDKLYEAKISEAIKKGLLAKINYWCVDNDIDYSNIKWHGRQYDEKDLNRKICVKEYDDAILKEYKETLREKFGKHKTICFCATVEHTHRMDKLFNQNGIKAVGLTAKYNKNNCRVTIHDSQRRKIVEGFKRGDYDIIFVRDLFNEGIDIPDCDSVMMLRPTMSHTIFTQQIGRGLRVSKDKDDVLILDFTGNCKNCMINFEILNEMLELNIIRDIKNKRESIKGEIQYLNNGCKVRLTKNKINTIIGDKNYTREQLTNSYFILKDQLGRNPLMDDLINGEYSSYYYEKLFGSWTNFLELMGEKHSNIKIDKLKEDFYVLKKELGRTPTIKEMIKANNISSYYYKKLFGSWTKFLIKLGEHNESKIKVMKEKIVKKLSMDERGDKGEKVKEIYLQIKNELGRVPRYKELIGMGKVSRRALNKYYSTYSNLLKIMGDFKEKIKIEKIPKLIINHEQEFKRIYGNEKIPISRLRRENYYIYFKFVRNKLLDKYCIRSKLGSSTHFNDNNFYMNKVSELFPNYKPSPMELNKKDASLYQMLAKRKLIDSVCIRNRKAYRTIGASLNHNWAKLSNQELLNKANEIIKNNNIKSLKELYKHKGSICNNLRKRGLIKSICASNNWTYRLGILKEQAIEYVLPYQEENYKKIKELAIKLGRTPTSRDLNNSHIYIDRRKMKHNELMNQLGLTPNRIGFKKKSDSNIKIISEYKPITIIPIKPKQKGDKHKTYEGLVKADYSNNTSKEDKIDIRERILSKIKDGDTVLLLESPDLTAIKEIERKEIKPKKIVIPNHLEFNKLAQELRNYKTNLNIECINTSALQYLVDSEEKFDFIWLDYCGAFSYYMKDLDILFAKHFGEMKLILTYNLFDPIKEDENYYFTRVIDYVLNKTNGKGNVRLINDVTYRYKKNMYNIGFNINKNEVDSAKL